MANVIGGSTARGSGALERRVWMMAVATAVLGGIAALTALWRSASGVGLVCGGLSLLAGAYAQMLSTVSRQRWFAICGAVAGGFGMAMGVGHGGLF